MFNNCLAVATPEPYDQLKEANEQESSIIICQETFVKNIKTSYTIKENITTPNLKLIIYMYMYYKAADNFLLLKGHMSE